MRRSTNARVWYKVRDIIFSLFLFLCLAFLFLVSASGYMVIIGQSCFAPKKADVLIIPGAMTGSLSLYYRCDEAIELYKKGYAEKIITTGAKGADEYTEEAKDAAEYMMKKGVDKNDILLEVQSHNTWQNLSNAKEIMKENNLKTAVIVTSDFHLYRSMQFARILQMDVTGAPSKTHEPERLQHTLREILAVLKYAFSDRF